jgi:hypothetical protein
MYRPSRQLFKMRIAKAKPTKPMRISPRAVQSFASTNCDTWYAINKANAKRAIVEYNFVRGAKLI